MALMAIDSRKNFPGQHGSNESLQQIDACASDASTGDEDSLHFSKAGAVRCSGRNLDAGDVVSNLHDDRCDGDTKGARCISLALEIAQHTSNKLSQQTSDKLSQQTSQSAHFPCGNCGKLLGSGFRFCTDCGQQVCMPCGNCGHLLSAGFKFCTDCGHEASSSVKAANPKSSCNAFNNANCAWSAQAAPLCTSTLFNPAPQAKVKAPVMNELLYGLLERMSPDVVNEIKKSNDYGNSVLLQAMPDHYDD